VIRTTSVKHVGIVSIQGCEGFTELIEALETISIFIVASHEKFNLFWGGEDSNLRESFSDFVNSDDSTFAVIKYSKAII